MGAGQWHSKPAMRAARQHTLAGLSRPPRRAGTALITRLSEPGGAVFVSYKIVFLVSFSYRTMTQDSAKPIKTAESDRPYPIGIDPAAYEGDIVSRLRHWRGLHLAHNGELFEAAADEIERLRTIMYRIVDEDCTVAIQGGTFYADDEPLFAISDTNEPRNGAVVGPDPDSRVWETPVHTPPTQTTPGEGRLQPEGTT